MPGVESVALSENVPSHPTDYRLVPEGHRAPLSQAGYDVLRIVCDDRYFATLQMPILQGRGFDAGDRDTSPRVGIVNEQFVERFWPGPAAVGRHLRLERADGPDVEVVGVVRAPIRDAYVAPPGATVFLPYEQNQRTRMTIVTMFPPNAPTYVGVPLAVLAICAIAAWVPARRAASIDPLEALRQE